MSFSLCVDGGAVSFQDSCSIVKLDGTDVSEALRGSRQTDAIEKQILSSADE